MRLSKTMLGKLVVVDIFIRTDKTGPAREGFCEYCCLLVMLTVHLQTYARQQVVGEVATLVRLFVQL